MIKLSLYFGFQLVFLSIFKKLSGFLYLNLSFVWNQTLILCHNCNLSYLNFFVLISTIIPVFLRSQTQSDCFRLPAFRLINIDIFFLNPRLFIILLVIILGLALDFSLHSMSAIGSMAKPLIYFFNFFLDFFFITFPRFLLLYLLFSRLAF